MVDSTVQQVTMLWVDFYTLLVSLAIDLRLPHHHVQMILYAASVGKADAILF